MTIGWIGFFLAMALTFLAMPRVIRFFRRKQLGQTQREEGPQWHYEKEGTPTMGGVVFLSACLVTLVFLAILKGQWTSSLTLLVFVLLYYGGVGIIDDYIILFMKRNEGLTSKQKFLLQILGGLIFSALYLYFAYDTTMALPFSFGEVDLGYFYILFAVFWLVGFSNAVNLTDGIDGLSSSTSIIALAFYAVLAFDRGQEDVFVFVLSLIGGLVAFLYFNKKPAKIFMGDVGSLALGAIFACLSMVLDLEWSLLLIGMVFVIETLSVILQVLSFKLTGKRIFKMSPIHHHFEMEGWSERQIVVRFSLFGFLMGLLALWIYL